VVGRKSFGEATRGMIDFYIQDFDGFIPRFAETASWCESLGRKAPP